MSAHFNRPPRRARARTETLRIVGDLMVAVGFGLLVLFALRMF